MELTQEEIKHIETRRLGKQRERAVATAYRVLVRAANAFNQTVSSSSQACIYVDGDEVNLKSTEPRRYLYPRVGDK